tara:strand:+ start:1647 stop:2273 length:627 start_codon:yes stop_codon:yes gene_type:complete
MISNEPALLTDEETANYFLSLASKSRKKGITNLKLQKLMYYAQSLHLALFDRLLFAERIEAWDYGPVLSDMYHEYKIYKNNPLPFLEIDLSIYNSKLRQYLNTIYQNYGKHSAWELKKLTHIKNAPWDMVYEEKGFMIEIPLELMQQFYKKILSIAKESKTFNVELEEIKFCYKVEQNALLNPDLPMELIIDGLINTDELETFDSLDD